MSELHVNGPLDIFRKLNYQAEEYDSIAPDYLYEFPDEGAAYQNEVIKLDKLNPLLGCEVTVHGAPITISRDEEGNYAAFALAPETPESRIHPPLNKTEGVYNGYTLLSVYNTALKGYRPTVVHMIKTAEHTYPNDFGHTQKTTYYTYVPVRGSEVIPLLPVYSHSLRDLKEDEITINFDEIAFDMGIDISAKFRQLGRYVNKVLGSQKEAEDLEMTRQRISYLNSLGVLEGRTIFARDFVVCDEADPYNVSAATYCSDMKKIVKLTPTIFVPSTGYDRNYGTPLLPAIVLREHQELYIEAIAPDSKIVMAPVKTILAVGDES